ncbi:hypothetical protein ENHAE0001_0820 [Enhydrobacter aerosaccus SK60]|nr:hypothetical protein ENHAE0001_0820 [Enhydrobacter aerosaccus SK60]
MRFSILGHWVKMLGNYPNQTQNFNCHKMKYLSHLKTLLAQ